MYTIRTLGISICILIGMVFVIGFGPTAHELDARSDVVAAWEATYPNSASFDNAGCQLCHQSSGGGDGWNAYGWSIRQGIYDDGLTPAAAILAVAALDADNNSISNFSEITEGNAQPGWKAGAVNSVYFIDGTVLSNQSAPTTISGSIDAGTSTVPNPTGTKKLFLPYVTKQ